MKYLLERVRKTAEALAAQIYVENSPVSGIRIQEGICALPAEADASPDAWQPFGRQDSWGGFEAHAWFQFSIEIPVSLTGRPAVTRRALERLAARQIGRASCRETV